MKIDKLTAIVINTVQQNVVKEFTTVKDLQWILSPTIYRDQIFELQNINFKVDDLVVTSIDGEDGTSIHIEVYATPF